MSDSSVQSVWIRARDSSGNVVGSGSLTKRTAAWTGAIDVSATGNLYFEAFAYNSKDKSGALLYSGSAWQVIQGLGADSVTIGVSPATSTVGVSFSPSGATSIPYKGGAVVDSGPSVGDD